MKESTIPSNEQTIEKLNSFLRGELAAVETYSQALPRVENVSHRATIEDIHRSHQRRAELLNEEVRRRGGTPAESSGAWGTFANSLEGAAKLLGAKASFAVLEQGEDHGRDGYQRDLDQLDSNGRRLIESRILPEQHRTHDALSSLMRQLA